VLAEQLSIALEQRREQPTALRAFVKRTGRLDGGGTLIAGAGVLSASIFASAALSGSLGVATFLLGATVAPFGYFVGAARRLTLLGFAHRDLEAAFKGESDQAREELAAEHGLEPSAIERWLPVLTKTSAGVSGLIVATLTLLPKHFLVRTALGPTAEWIAVISGTVALLTTITLLARLERHRDVSTEFWSKVWVGRIGKMAFTVARKLLGNRTIGSATTHRATELSLGMAAEQLYESLPKDERQQLGDLPALLRRLQVDAQFLRVRYEELQEALKDAGDAGSGADYAELRSARDTIHAKLGDAVGALETIRLNLLRLHAGSATVEGLTTHLGLAAEVSKEVERIIAAQREVDAVIEFPRETAATPI
jgi:serine/threonine-protein kinase